MAEISESIGQLPKSTDSKNFKKRLIATIAAVVMFVLFMFVIPVPEGIDRPALATTGLLIACIIIWLTESMPFIITVVAILALMPIVGVFTFPEACMLFSSPVVFFVLFSFGLSAAVTMTPIPYRVANSALKFAKQDSRKLILAFVMATTVLSMFISDLAACSIFVGLAYAIIKANGNPKKGESELAKALMIGIAAGAGIGGFATPIGNNVNMLSITMVEQFMGLRVTFLNYCIIGVPLALIASTIVGIWLGRAFKVESVSEEAIIAVREITEGFGRLSAQEIKLIVWFLVMFALWMAGTWIPSINTIHVALLGLVVAFVPGIDLLERDYYYSKISWDVFLMNGGVSVLATGLVNTGIASWFVGTVLSGASTWPFLLVVFAMCIITAFVHFCIPVGAPTVSVALPILVTLAAATGVNGAIIVIIGAVLGGVTTFMPIDLLMLIAYSEGWISMKSWIKVGWFPTVLLICLCTVCVPFMTMLLGY